MSYLTFFKEKKESPLVCKVSNTVFIKGSAIERGYKTATCLVGLLDPDHLKALLSAFLLVKWVKWAQKGASKGTVEMSLCKGASGLGMWLLFSTNCPTTKHHLLLSEAPNDPYLLV